jgi:hypothetical protein
MIASPIPGRMIPRVYLLLSVAAILGAAGGPAAAADPTAPRVLAQDREGVRFALELPGPDWRAAPAAAGGEAAWDAVLPGFSAQGTPGQTRVPRRGGWLIVPPGTVPRLEVIGEDWRPLDGARRLALEPVPVLYQDPATGDVSERPWLPGPGRELPRDQVPAAALADMQVPDPALVPGAAVRLGETAWWRGRRIVAYTVLPLRLDGEGRAREALRAGEWRVRFVPDPTAGDKAPPAALRRLGGRNDERFAGYFLNGALLPGLATEAAHRGLAAGGKTARPARRGAPLGYPEVRIPVRRTELHRVRAGELQAAGLLPQTTLQRSQIRLYQRRYLPQLDDPLDDEAVPYLEIEVPIHIPGEGEIFGAGDLFLFWGLRPRDDGAFTELRDGVPYAVAAVGDTLEISNENNAYWLQLADPEPGQSWARMAVVGLPPAQGAPAAAYRRTDYYNEALVYRENIPDIATDRYYFNRARDQEVRVALNAWSPVADQGGAVLQAGLANSSPTSRTYQFDLVSGETVVAALPTFTTASLNVQTYQAEIPPGALSAPNLALRVRNASSTQPVRCYLDWVRVRYDALYAAPFGRLLFSGGDAAQLADLQIAGFVTDDVGLIEVTDPRRPAWVALAPDNLIADGDQWRLSLQVDQAAGQRRFYTAVRMTSNGVPDIRYSDASLAAEPVVPTRLAEAGADVLVVVHPEFRAAAEAWLEHRRGRAGPAGLTFQVVAPQDLYDWYTGGLKDPWAIKRLVNHALDSPTWGTWALVLIGSANENPRELGVLSSGRQWSRDWVPTHFHVQNAGFNLPPEVLASDKWYAAQAAGEAGFPGNVTVPTDLYVGRLPVHSAAELQRVLAKIQQVETAAPGQDWRRRGLFIADDAYSSGSLGAGGSTLVFQASETDFETSEVQVLAATWADNAGQVALVAEPVLLRPYMEPIYPPPGQEISISVAREWCRTSGAPQGLIAALSRGATLAHFQGHANHWLLTHEIWFEHDMRSTVGRRDVDLLTNTGRPWLFCGMGCHIGDFIQNVAGVAGIVEPGLGEKMLLWTAAGAVAVYASSGYEFLSLNRTFSETFIRRLIQRPPHATVDGRTVTSRWLLGEVMWASEADQLAQANTTLNRQMVYQYLILGDPLLVLDAGLPEVEAVLLGADGGPLGDLTGDLRAVDASGRRTVEVRARDEAGVDRLLVLDTRGQDLTAQTVTATPFYDTGSRQIMDYVLDLPVRPFAHDLLVRVYDSAAPLAGDASVLLTLRVAQEITTYLADGGEPLDPQTFTFVMGEPVDLELQVDSAAWFDESTTVVVTAENLELSGVATQVVGNHTLRVACTVTVPETAAKARQDRGLRLVIDGFASDVPLEASAVPGGEGTIASLVSFPNPMQGATRFVFATGLASGSGRVRVWTVSGREVARVDFPLSGTGQEVVAWDGRDREGDRLANGTYLYRVELEGPAGRVRSEMQRLVIMR